MQQPFCLWHPRPRDQKLNLQVMNALRWRLHHLIDEFWTMETISASSIHIFLNLLGVIVYTHQYIGVIWYSGSSLSLTRWQFTKQCSSFLTKYSTCFSSMLLSSFSTRDVVSFVVFSLQRASCTYMLLPPSQNKCLNQKKSCTKFETVILGRREYHWIMMYDQQGTLS